MKALEVLGGIILKYYFDAPSIARVLREEPPPLHTSPSFEAMVFVKKTNTLAKRAASLRLYAAWFETAGFGREAFGTESVVFKYMQHLFADNSPASRAASLREAMNFLSGVLSLDFSDLQASTRVRGMCCRLLRTRQAVRQRAPLSVKMVKALEDLLAREAAAGTVDAVLAASTLFAVYSRSRVGDLRRCSKEPSLEIDGARTLGFLETHLEEHKTARPGSRRALPVAAPVFGLTEHCWGEDFVVARRTAGVTAGDGSSLVPALVGDDFGGVPYKTTEFSTAFRALLVKLGFRDQIEHVGAHSLKTTLLSWAAKFGVDRDHRRLLGYHAAPGGDGTVDIYARDVMAVPLRALSAMLSEIRAGAFDPDSTRSGTFAAPPAAESVPAVQEVASVSSAASSASAPGTDDEEIVVDEDCTVVCNVATCFYHIARDSSVLVCGKNGPFGGLCILTRLQDPGCAVDASESHPMTPKAWSKE